MRKANKIKRLLAFVAIAATLAVVATIVVRSGGGKPPVVVKKLPVKVDLSLQGLHYTDSKQGVKQWDLAAEQAEYNKESNKTTLSRVSLTVINSGAGDLRVTAERAEYDNASRNVLLSGGVQGESTKGMRFSTPRIRFVAADSELQTDDPVRFSDSRLVVEGVGMRYHTKTRRLQLMQQVSATVQAKVGR